MNRPKIEIKTKDGTSGIFAEIFIDGHKLRGVRRATLVLEGGFNKMPTLTLDINALDISVDGEFLVMQEGYGEIGICFKEQEGEWTPSRHIKCFLETLTAMGMDFPYIILPVLCTSMK